MSIKIDVVTDLDRRSTRETAAEAQQYFERAGRDAGNSFGTNLSQGIDSASPKVEKSARNIEKSFDKAADAAGRLRVEQEKLDALVSRGDAPREKLIAQQVRVEKARRDESSAVRDVTTAYRDFSTVAQTAGSAAASAAGQVGELAGSATKLSTALGPAGIAAAVVIGGQAILQLGGIAASASQSLLLLPAAAGAAGAAFGTLALATLGFGDAIKDIRDPEKFAEDLRALSPVAQEAALAIQSLLPSFDQLKNATQDAFFNGVGTMLNQLANQYLPTIQSATTGIASAFNSMLQGATNQLMTPETQASIQTFLGNTVAAFQNLAPAVAPLTKALADLMAVGSGFLPGLAQAATDAANSFSQFITQARLSGDLNKWMSEGLATLKDLGSIAWDLGRAFIELAPLGRQALPLIVQMFRSMADIIPFVVEALKPIGPTLGVIANGVKIANDSFGSMKGVVQDVANTVIPVINSIAQAASAMLGPIRTAIDAANLLPGVNIPQIPGYTNINQLGGPPAPGGGLGAQAERRGATPRLPTAGLGTGAALPTGVGLGSGFSYSPPPDQIPGWGERPAGFTPARGGGGGGGGGAAATPFIDPTKFQGGDPLAGMPAPVAGADQQAIYAADSKLITATHDLEQKKLALQVLEAKGNASQQELLTAKNDLQERERALAAAQAEDVAVRTGQMKKAAEGLKEIKGIFAPMDDDLGISGGLPGIAKYFTTLLGNFALAGAIRSSPMLQAAALSMQGGGGGLSGGYGGGYGGYGGGALGGYAGDAALLSGVPRGRYDSSAKDLSRGLADCSSSVEDLVNMLDGRSTQGGSLTTNNAASMLPGMGFAPGNGGLGDFRIAFNPSHMQATLPGGTPFNWGSDAAAARGGVGGSGADDPALTQHYYRPVASAMGPAWFGGGLGPRPGPGYANGGVLSGYSPGKDDRLVPLAGGEGIIRPEAVRKYGAGFIHMLNSGFNTGGVFNPGMKIDTSTTESGQSNFMDILTYGLANGVPIPTLADWHNKALVGGVFGTARRGYATGGINDPESMQPAATGGGGAGPGGLADAAAGAAGAALPGVGQAAGIGIKLAGRAIQQAGQYAAIGVGGLMETFLPHDSPLAGNSWLSKIAGGISGARPASPNLAGQAAPPMPSGTDHMPGQVNNDHSVNIAHMSTEGKDGQAVTNDIARYQAGGPR